MRRLNCLATFLAVLVTTGCGRDASPAPETSEEAASDRTSWVAAEKENAKGGSSTGRRNADASQSSAAHTASNHVSEPTSGTTPSETSRAKASFDRLAEAYQGENPETWDKAWNTSIETFGELGPSGINVLVETLKTGETRERELASTLLAALGIDSEQATSALLQALQDEWPLVRLNAASALSHSSQHMEQVVPVLVDLLADSREVVRTAAVTSLGTLGRTHISVVPKISQALSDSSPAVRQAAADALGKIGPPAAETLPALEKLKDDPEAFVRSAAAEAIAKVRIGPTAVRAERPDTSAGNAQTGTTK